MRFRLDEHVSFMAGHLTGWVRGGGDTKDWIAYFKLTEEEMSGLVYRMEAISKRISKSSTTTITTDDVEETSQVSGWVVVWDHAARRLTTMTLSKALGANAEAVAEDFPSDSTILSVWDTEAKASSALEMLEPMFLRRMS